VLCASIYLINAFVLTDNKGVPQRIVAGLAVYTALRECTPIFPAEGTTATSEHAQVGVLGELLTIFLFVFSTGPIRVFLDTKIGNTSIDKLVEDYHEDRA
jgi:hypothetical protein